VNGRDESTLDADGFVLVFERQANGQFAFSAKLFANDREPFGPRGRILQEFGAGAAITGDTLLVGAHDDRNGTGAVYVFRFQSGGWRQTQKLLPGDEVREGKGFGRGLDARGNIAAITAFGGVIFNPVMAPAVYMFVDNGTSWQQKQKLTDPDPTDSETGSFAVLGAVAIDTQHVVVGETSAGLNLAPHEAYVFERRGMQWTPTAKLLRAPEFSNVGGQSIHLSRNVVLMNARPREIACGPNVVFAYDLFTYATR
jgi:FG-GAP repeat